MKNITDTATNSCSFSTKKQKLKKFLHKYFLEGQQLDEEKSSPSSNEHSEVPSGMEKSFLEKHRKIIGFLIPMCFMQLIWWTLAIRYNIFRLYPTRYELALTMVLGATVAGATSEGGGAIAFPIMTLALHIDATVARDFSLMIQSCGMTSAAFTIIWMKIVIEWPSIIICSLGSTIGIIFGFQWVDDLLTSQQKKMLFVSIWFSFALALYLLNMQKKRKTYKLIPRLNIWKGLILFVTGIVGGLCSSFAGSGVDICSFSILTLLFRVSEKVATPTSVVLMATNTCVGFFWRQLIMNGISKLAWEYFSVSVPVVVICAPLGSLIASHFHRLVLASFVYILEVLALIGFLITRPPLYLIICGAAIITSSFIFFILLIKAGERMANHIESKNEVEA